MRYDNSLHWKTGGQAANFRGVDPYGTGGTRPPQYLDRGGHDHECPPQYF